MLFCLVGLSGSVLAFRPQIEAAFEPKSSCETAYAAFDAQKAMAALNVVSRDLNPDRIVFPVTSNQPFIFQLQKSDPVRIAYDPCSNRVLGTLNLGWLDWIADLHHNLLAGKTGRRFVGGVGIALLLSSLSGLIVWFTATHRRPLTILWRASSRRVIYDFHRSAGLLALLVLLVQACTGIALAYPQLVSSMLGDSPRTSPKAKQRKTATNTHRAATKPSLTDVIRLARQAIPDATIRELRGLAGGAQIEVRCWRPGDIRASGNNVVKINAAATKVVSAFLLDHQTMSYRILQLVTSIHYVEWGGFGSRMLLALAGPTLVFLFLSGLLIRWWPKRNRKLSTIAAHNNDLLSTLQDTPLHKGAK